MIIFEDPRTAPVVGLVLAMVFFAIQLLLCFKGKNTMIKWLPTCIVLLFWLFVLFICMGAFGEGSGFLGGVHLIMAAILAIVCGIASIGILAAWIVYKIRIRKKNGMPLE